METAVGARAPGVFSPARWGLPPEAVSGLAGRLHGAWQRYHGCFTTRTHDTSDYGLGYLRGIVTMDCKRNYANIARRVFGPEDDGQNLQQFMSDSPWDPKKVFAQIQKEVGARQELAGGALTLDESGQERAGNQCAGAARQWLGREGKTDMGQVGVILGYHQAGTWAMVDAELYLPTNWFDDGHAQLRERWYIPADRAFKTKQELGLEMIRDAKARHLPFEVVVCDSNYGRDGEFRAALDAEGLVYMTEVPADTVVYLTPPLIGVPQTPKGKRGRHFKLPRVLNGAEPISVQALAQRPEMALQPLAIRQSERGVLTYSCAARRVYTVGPKKVARPEWAFVRREGDGKLSFSLSNAPKDTPLPQLAQWRCQRYFVERTIEDAKSEAGWDELVARKYRAWMHHVAIDALALWFVAETRLDWAQQYPRDPELVRQLEVEVLPALSMANVRELLKAVLPREELSPDEAARLVVKHLVNRSHSTASRLEAQRQNRALT